MFQRCTYVHSLKARMSMGTSHESYLQHAEHFQRMINDTFGLPEMALFGPMTPEDMQLFQQQMQAENQAKMAMQQARLQAQGEHQDSKDETILLKTLLEKILTPDAAHAMLNDMTGGSLPMSNETNDSSQSGA